MCLLLFHLSSPGEVRSLWIQLRRDEPHLLSNFEEFLARVTHQIKEAHQEKKEMESALQRYTHVLMAKTQTTFPPAVVYFSYISLPGQDMKR